MATMDALKAKGNDAFKKDDFSDAINSYTKAIAVDPNCEAAGALYSNRAACYSSLQEHDKALKDSENCIRVRPAWLKGYFRKGVALEATGKLDDAVKAYELSLLQEPTNAEVQTKLTHLEAAIQDRNDKMTMDERRANGNEAFNAKQFSAAIDWYSIAIQIDPNCEAAGALYSNRAACYTNLQQYDKAISDGDSCIRVRPKWLKGYYRKAVALESTGRLADAVKAYQQSLLQDPTNAEVQAKITQLQAAVHDRSPCFHNAPKLSTEEAITAAMTQLTEAPEHRPDLVNYLPDADDTVTFIAQMQRQFGTVHARSRTLIDKCGLTGDEVKMLIAYKMEQPYNFYKWVNAWLTGARRENAIVNAIGPAFTLLYRAQEKLPVVTKKCGRAIEVGNIPTLQDAFVNFKTRFAPGSPVNFWGFSSFSTDDKVVNKFMAAPDKDSIVYTCGKLTGVQMDPFAPGGMATEAEILPLAPSLFRVIAVIKVHRCVLVTVEQQNNIGESYVVPVKSN